MLFRSLEIPDLRGIDLGQPDMMDTKLMYKMCSEKKVAITSMKPTKEDLVRGRAIQEYPTGAVFLYNTEDVEDAKDVVNKYRNQAK